MKHKIFIYYFNRLWYLIIVCIPGFFVRVMTSPALMCVCLCNKHTQMRVLIKELLWVCEWKEKKLSFTTVVIPRWAVSFLFFPGRRNGGEVANSLICGIKVFAVSLLLSLSLSLSLPACVCYFMNRDFYVRVSPWPPRLGQRRTNHSNLVGPQRAAGNRNTNSYYTKISTFPNIPI